MLHINQRHSSKNKGENMHSILLIMTVLFGSLSQAEIPLVLFEGRDLRSGRICQLKITSIKGIHPEDKNFAIEVETSYSHDKDQAPPIIVNKWVGQTLRGENGPNKISVFFTGHKDDFQFKSITGFALSWFHINHPHNYRCADLQLK